VPIPPKFAKIGGGAAEIHVNWLPPRTVQDYFQVLEDTLIGFILPAFTNTLSRKAMTSAKFYLFDTGVTNALLGRTALKAGTTEFGDLFEQYIVAELRAYLSYKQVKAHMFYWRSLSKLEVDVIIQKQNGEVIAIEIKGHEDISQKELRGLIAFSEDFPNAKKIVVSLEGRRRLHKSGTEIIPAFEFLQALWSHEIIE
jgi:predicted AAA+ superfamily ATPase